MAPNKNWDWTPKRRRLVVNLWKGGVTSNKIAERLGPEVTKNMVIGLANRMGLEARASVLPAKYLIEKKRLKDAKPFPELGPRECLFPLGEIMKKPKLFCARPVKENSPYCAEHLKLCHTKTPGLNK